MIERELRFRVVLPHVFCIEETPQPRDLRRQVYHDDLHLDVQLQPQDLGAPREHAQLKMEIFKKIRNCSWRGMMATHLSVLFVASEQHVRRGLEGKVTHRILFDDAREGCICLALMVGLRLGGVLRPERVSKTVARV